LARQRWRSTSTGRCESAPPTSAAFSACSAKCRCETSYSAVSHRHFAGTARDELGHPPHLARHLLPQHREHGTEHGAPKRVPLRSVPYLGPAPPLDRLQVD